MTMLLLVLSLTLLVAINAGSDTEVLVSSLSLNSSSRIVGGTNAQKGDYPFYAYLGGARD